jgi:hypothetical protein
VGAVFDFVGPIEVMLPSSDASFNPELEGASVSFVFSVLDNGNPSGGVVLPEVAGCGTLGSRCLSYDDLIGAFANLPVGTSTVDLTLTATAEASSVPEPSSFNLFASALVAFIVLLMSISGLDSTVR